MMTPPRPWQLAEMQNAISLFPLAHCIPVSADCTMMVISFQFGVWALPNGEPWRLCVSSVFAQERRTLSCFHGSVYLRTVFPRFTAAAMLYFRRWDFSQLESGPTQAVLPPVRLAAGKIIRDRYGIVQN